MKTKKVVIGAMTAALLSLTFITIPVTLAAGETVQISVGSDEAAPGGEFSVDVMLTDIPSAGIQACDFAIQFDSSLITVTSVSAGTLTETGASEADPTSSIVPVFDSYVMNDEGYVCLTWSTSLDDSRYWLQGSGVLCTVTGTVSDSAVSGTEAALELVALSDSGTINAGYMSGTSAVRYDVSTADGAITIASEETDPTATGTYLYGDANLDGEVNITDAVCILSYVSNTEKYPLDAIALDISDVNQRGDGLSYMDALAVQKLISQQLTALPES